jgi:hypothetical protein
MKPLPLILAIGFAILYGIFTNQNEGIDAWFYAASVKHQEQIWQAHHLLFNAVQWCFWKCLCLIKLPFAPLRSIQLLNSLGAGVAIYTVYAILLQWGKSYKTALVSMAFVGACFSIMRFASSAETYILPIVFSLLATYYYGKQQKRPNQSLLITGLFCSISILLHQVQIWWTIALLVNTILADGLKKKSLAFVLGLTLVPLSYALVAYFSNAWTLQSLVLGEYLNEHAHIHWSMNNIALTGINSVRSFIQIHGLIWNILEQYPSLACMALPALTAIGINSIKILKSTHKKKTESIRSPWILIALVLHIFFAFVSDGNAEFLAMLPFLSVFYLVQHFETPITQSQTMLILGLLTWNLLFGLWPNAFLITQPSTPIVKFIEQAPQADYYLSQKPLIENRLCEKYGFKHGYKLHPIADFKAIDSSNTVKAFTDYGYRLSKWSRAAWLEQKSKLFNPYQLAPADSFESLYGENYLYQILPKQ